MLIFWLLCLVSGACPDLYTIEMTARQNERESDFISVVAWAALASYVRHIIRIRDP
jgi:hypothetical protein